MITEIKNGIRRVGREVKAHPWVSLSLVSFGLMYALGAKRVGDMAYSAVYPITRIPTELVGGASHGLLNGGQDGMGSGFSWLDIRNPSGAVGEGHRARKTIIDFGGSSTGSNTGGNNGSTGGSSDGSTGSTGGSTEIGDWKSYTIASGRAIGDETNFTACQVWDRKDPKSTVQVLIQPQVELYADPSTAEGTCWTVVDALSEQAIRNQLEYLAEKKKAEFASNGIDFKPGTVTIDSQDDTDVSSLPGDWNS